MKINGFIYAAISAIFFGSAGLFIKHGYSQSLSPEELLTLQYIIAVAILFLLCLIWHKKSLKLSRKSILKLIILGAVGNTLMTVSLYNAMAHLDMAVVTMLLFTYPAMVALYSFLFYKERISGSKITAIIGTFIGSILVINIWSGFQSSLSIIGISFAILSAVSYAFMNIYSSSIVEDIPAIVITFYSTLFSLIILLLFNFDFASKLLYMNRDIILNAALLAFFCEIIPLTLLYAAIRYIGPVRASIISTLELPVSAVTAFLIMGEKLFLSQYAGIAIVLLSVIILKKD